MWLDRGIDTGLTGLLCMHRSLFVGAIDVVFCYDRRSELYILSCLKSTNMSPDIMDLQNRRRGRRFPNAFLFTQSVELTSPFRVFSIVSAGSRATNPELEILSGNRHLLPVVLSPGPSRSTSLTKTRRTARTTERDAYIIQRKQPQLLLL